MARTIRDMAGEIWEILEEHARMRTRAPQQWSILRLRFRQPKTGEEHQVGSSIKLNALSDADLRRSLHRARRRSRSAVTTSRHQEEGPRSAHHTAEGERTPAEEQRQVAEEMRISAEAERNLEAELTWRHSEDGGDLELKARRNVEITRGAAESMRMAAEVLRKAAAEQRQATAKQREILQEMKRTAAAQRRAANCSVMR